MYSYKQNNNEKCNGESELDWDDPCIGGASPPFFYPSYYLHTPTAAPLNSSAISRHTCSKNSFHVYHDRKMYYKGRVPNEEEEEEEEDEEADDDDDDEISFYSGVRGYYENNTWICICFQVILWLLVSVGIFIVLFSIATRPGSPQLTVKRIELNEFRVAEGSDKSGVPTKVFSCSCNVSLDLDNHSQFFGVHLHPAHITMSFAELTIATGH
ncbi:hypothetical protein KI387_013503, partial [Taxus chinensis]